MSNFCQNRFVLMPVSALQWHSSSNGPHQNNAKPPFAGSKQVLDYVGRYTHRVAISNHRLLDIEDGQVQFRDYTH
jgi:Putative transposase